MRIIITGLIVLLSCQWSWAQELSVEGKITDPATNEPIVGALVTVTGTSTSTLTNTQGEYKLSISDSYQSLTITADGYTTQEVFLGGKTKVDLSLKSSASTNRLKNTLGSEDLGNQPVVDLEQSTQGRAAGVFVQNSGGKLGQGTKVRIRGGSSLTGSNEPLYVVDGVPLTSDNQSDIDPSTIESMEILKDAAATAIYGSRASNGVVLITTKKGKSGKIKADVEYQFGISQAQKRLDLMSADDYRLLFFEYTMRALLAGLPVDGAGLSASNLASFISQENLEIWYKDLVDLRNNASGSTVTYAFPNGDELTMSTNNPIFRNVYDTDWHDEAFRTGISHRGNVNVSGGSSKQQVFANINYLDQEGILIGNTYERLGARLNFASEWSDRVSSNISIGYARTVNNRVNEDGNDGNPVQMVLLPPGDQPDPNNNYALRVRSSEYNPQTEIYGSTNLETANRLNGSASVNVELTDNLELNVDGGIDYLDILDERRQGPATQEGTPDGFSQIGTSEVFNYLFNGSLNYNKSIGENSLGVMVGSSYQRSQSLYTYRSARINSLADLESLPETNPSLLSIPVPGSAFAFLSFFGSVDYQIANKYSVALTARADGSSRFSEENQIGVFPAASFGWTLSNESFLAGNNRLSFLQLDLSFGLLGNTPFDDFLYRTNYYNVLYGDNSGVRISNLGNTGLKWESTQQFDAGLSFGFLANKITGSITYYLKNTSDLLFPVPVTQTTGFASVIQNGGELSNSGIEFEITSTNVEQGEFSWQTSFNISTNKNEIKDIGGRPLISGANAFIEGEAAGVFYLPKYLGVDPSSGRALYDDGNGLATTNYDDALANGRQVVGNPNPKYYGGLTNNLSYNDFDFSFMFQFVQGIDIYWETGEIIANSGYGLYNQTKDQLDRWYKSGDQAANPVMNPALETPNPSSRWIVDASYIRLKTVTLSYNVPVTFGTLSFYVAGQNLVTFTDYPGFDPDVSYSDPSGGEFAANINRGIDFFTAPQPRVFTTGIKIGF
ncbi:MAG: SusC/RagA family TonB-linked outer membrane protein [Cyclobacteriaceae bacterium]